jgi:hypothetical protein
VSHLIPSFDSLCNGNGKNHPKNHSDVFSLYSTRRLILLLASSSFLWRIVRTVPFVSRDHCTARAVKYAGNGEQW